MRHAGLGLASMGLVLMGLAGCSADAAPPPRGGAPAGGAAGSSPTGGGTAGFGGGFSGQGGGIPLAGSGASGSGGIDNSCGGQTYTAEAKTKLDIYMVYDDSGSMLLFGFWEPTKMAAKAFLNDPASGGIGVGLKFFGSNCDPNFYANPDVPMGDLPAHGATLSAALDQRFPIANTMTDPALRGAVMHQRQWAATHPDSKPIILLITDGEPDRDCNGFPIGDGTEIAAESFNGTPSIPVYVMGLGNLNNINAIAQAGGTGQAFVVDPAASSGQAIVDAFNQIRNAATPLPCEFSIPAGGESTPHLVNLAYTPIGAAESTFIVNVGSAAACANHQNQGWFYDDPSAPTTIMTCSSTCTQLASGGTVEVALGCPTVVPE